MVCMGGDSNGDIGPVLQKQSKVEKSLNMGDILVADTLCWQGISTMRTTDPVASKPRH